MLASRQATLIVIVAFVALGGTEARGQLLAGRRSLQPSSLHAVHRPLCGQKTLLRWSYSSDEEETKGEPETGPPETIETDRPDFTEASSAVGLGVRQLEAGYTYFQNDDNGTRDQAHTYPEMLWRIGMLANWFEFRIGWTVLQESTTTAPSPRATAVGSDDLYLGAKLWLTEQEGILPEMSLVPQMRVPTGDPAFTTGEVMPGVNWLYGWEINDWLSAAGSTQGNRAQDELGEFFNLYAQSWTLGYQFTDRLGGYTEYFGLYPAGSRDPDTHVEHYFDGGFHYKITRDLQLDIRAGVGLNEAADDLFAGAGFALRF